MSVIARLLEQSMREPRTRVLSIAPEEVEPLAAEIARLSKEARSLGTIVKMIQGGKFRLMRIPVKVKEKRNVAVVNL